LWKPARSHVANPRPKITRLCCIFKFSKEHNYDKYSGGGFLPKTWLVFADPPQWGSVDAIKPKRVSRADPFSKSTSGILHNSGMISAATKRMSLALLVGLSRNEFCSDIGTM
jgi:hypothetical protein